VAKRAQEVFGWLELGRVRREEEQMDMLGDGQACTRMPACAVQDEHDLLGRTRPHGARKSGELDVEERDAHAGRQVKNGPARGGVHKADERAPGKPVPHRRHRALPNRGPHAAQKRLQANAVLIRRPELDPRVRKCRAHLP
jgi:hypothetical protein